MNFQEAASRQGTFPKITQPGSGGLRVAELLKGLFEGKIVGVGQGLITRRSTGPVGGNGRLELCGQRRRLRLGGQHEDSDAHQQTAGDADQKVG